MIGWREDALKMVFLVTDQNYHIAGDGKVLKTLAHSKRRGGRFTLQAVYTISAGKLHLSVVIYEM